MLAEDPPTEGKGETNEATTAPGAIDATHKNETQAARHDKAASEPIEAWVEGVSGPESRGADDGVAPHAEDGETKGREASADHRHAAEHTPGWLKHVKHWLNEATKSIPAYLERTAMVLDGPLRTPLHACVPSAEQYHRQYTNRQYNESTIVNMIGNI